jgi:hypothetical protein
MRPNPRRLDKEAGFDNIFGRGRLAQVDRALVSGTKGRAFESPIARQENQFSQRKQNPSSRFQGADRGKLASEIETPGPIFC